MTPAQLTLAAPLIANGWQIVTAHGRRCHYCSIAIIGEALISPARAPYHPGCAFNSPRGAATIAQAAEAITVRK